MRRKTSIYLGTPIANLSCPTPMMIACYISAETFELPGW